MGRMSSVDTHVLCLVAQSCPTLCNPMDYSPPGSSVHGDSPGKNTGVGCQALLQGIFPTQGLNPGLPHGRGILYQPSHQGSPRTLEWVAYLFSTGSSRPRNWTGVSCIAGRFFTFWATREAHASDQSDHCHCILLHHSGAVYGICRGSWATAAMGSQRAQQGPWRRVLLPEGKAHRRCMVLRLPIFSWFRFFFFLISTNSHLPSPLRVMEALPGMALASSISWKCQLFSLKDHKGFCFRSDCTLPKTALLPVRC